MRPPVLIYSHDGYTLESWGNGWAYTLTRTSDGASLFVQDDDAAQFRAGFDAAFNLSRSAVAQFFSEYDDVMRVEA